MESEAGFFRGSDTSNNAKVFSFEKSSYLREILNEPIKHLPQLAADYGNLHLFTSLFRRAQFDQLFFFKGFRPTNMKSMSFMTGLVLAAAETKFQDLRRISLSPCSVRYWD